MRDIKNNFCISPWHDLALIPSTFEENHLTGVIEITAGNTLKTEIDLYLPYNPMVPNTTVDKKTGEKKLRHYGKPIFFNYGFIP